MAFSNGKYVSWKSSMAKKQKLLNRFPNVIGVDETQLRQTIDILGVNIALYEIRKVLIDLIEQGVDVSSVSANLSSLASAIQKGTDSISLDSGGKLAPKKIIAGTKVIIIDSKDNVH